MPAFKTENFMANLIGCAAVFRAATAFSGFPNVAQFVLMRAWEGEGGELYAKLTWPIGRVAALLAHYLSSSG